MKTLTCPSEDRLVACGGSLNNSDIRVNDNNFPSKLVQCSCQCYYSFSKSAYNIHQKTVNVVQISQIIYQSIFSRLLPQNAIFFDLFAGEIPRTGCWESA